MISVVAAAPLALTLSAVNDAFQLVESGQDIGLLPGQLVEYFRHH
jgi:hypothetical protein